MAQEENEVLAQSLAYKESELADAHRMQEELLAGQKAGERERVRLLEE